MVPFTPEYKNRRRHRKAAHYFHRAMNTSAVRDIIAQIKSGKKDKAEAHRELKLILQQSTANGFNSKDISLDNGVSSNNRPESEEIGVENPESPSEDRRAMINQFIENQSRIKEKTSPLVELEERGRTYRSNSNVDSVTPSSRFNKSGLAQSMDDSLLNYDLKYNKAAQAEESIRREMFKECTFHPKIKKLPDAYKTHESIDDTPFHVRVHKWQQEKQDEMVRRKEFLDKNSTLDCTFHPRINYSSEKAVKELRGDLNESVSDRLFKASDRSLIERRRFIEEELRAQREEEEKECTFKPNIIKSNRFSDVQSKLHEPLKRNADDPSAKNLTFTPNVRGVKPSMSAAKMYVSTNVVDRLTRGTGSAQHLSQHNTADKAAIPAASYMDSLTPNDNSFRYQTPGAKSQQGRPSTAPSKQQSTNESVVLKKQEFNNFLGRNQQTVERKKKLVEQVQVKQTPKFKPTICKKSSELLENHERGEFLERYEKDQIKRTSEAKTPSDVSKCTFKPKLTMKTVGMRARSVDELSSGDYHKRQSNQQMMRIRSEQEALADLTFRPNISKSAQNTRGVLSDFIRNDDPGKLRQYYNEKIKERDALKKKADEDKLLKELKDCTFTPAIIDCPEYIKKIAKSIQVVKGATNYSPNSSQSYEIGKPLWK